VNVKDRKENEVVAEGVHNERRGPQGARGGRYGFVGHRLAGRIEAFVSIERADRLEKGVDGLDSVSRRCWCSMEPKSGPALKLERFGTHQVG
jgi:hypothetical protein